MTRTIYILLSGLGYPSDEPCSVSRCGKQATGKHWALLYEGEYISDEEKGAAMPVCSEHARRKINSKHGNPF